MVVSCSRYPPHYIHVLDEARENLVCSFQQTLSTTARLTETVSSYPYPARNIIMRSFNVKRLQPRHSHKRSQPISGLCFNVALEVQVSDSLEGPEQAGQLTAFFSSSAWGPCAYVPQRLRSRGGRWVDQRPAPIDPSPRRSMHQGSSGCRFGRRESSLTWT